MLIILNSLFALLYPSAFRQERDIAIASITKHTIGKQPILQRNCFGKDDDYRIDDDDGDEEVSFSRLNESDWDAGMETISNMMTLPTEPNAKFSAFDVAQFCIRSLQLVDEPSENAGLQKCFPFFTWECRKLVTARKGGDTVDRFCKYGLLSPSLQPFMGARRIDVGDITILPENPPMRGAIATCCVKIHTSNIFTVTHLSGMGRNGVRQEPPVVDMVVRLEKQRRPPYQNCWLVKEIMDTRMAFAGDMGNAGVAN